MQHDTPEQLRPVSGPDTFDKVLAFFEPPPFDLQALPGKPEPELRKIKIPNPGLLEAKLRKIVRPCSCPQCDQRICSKYRYVAGIIHELLEETTP